MFAVSVQSPTQPQKEVREVCEQPDCNRCMNQGKTSRLVHKHGRASGLAWWSSRGASNAVIDERQQTVGSKACTLRYRYGDYDDDMANMSTVQAIMRREEHFLRVLVPRTETWKTTPMEPLSILTRGRVFFLIFVFAIYTIACITCSKGTSENGHVLCSGGPFADPDAAFDWSDFRPAVLTTVASLLLAFYTNVCVNVYQQCYLATQDLRRAVIDVVTLAVGSFGHDARSQEVLNDVWRCVNLIHASAYVLSDKARTTYSFEHFLIPVGRAYGPWDGVERLGMFRKGELDRLMKASMWKRRVSSTTHLHMQSMARLQVTSSRMEELSEITPSDQGSCDRVASPSSGRLAPRPVLHRSGASPPPPAATGFNAISDMTGNNSSPAALAAHMYAIRLYRVIQLALERNMSSVAWPVWGAALSNLRSAAHDVERRGLYRFPVLYRHSVMLVVQLVIVYDVFVLGTVVGRLFHQGYSYAWFSTVLSTLTMLVLVCVITLITSAAEDMERPFGNDPLDLPGLSYVTGTATATLDMVVPPKGAGEHNAIATARQYIVDMAEADLFERLPTGSPPRSGVGE